MKITDLKCAIIGNSPVVRIVTDAGISGFAQVETFKPYLKPHVLAFHEALLDQDPTNVERVMQRIRQRGAFKPWGAAVSVIETALWDLAGKAAGVPVYKLLGGKVRDHVRHLQRFIALTAAWVHAGTLCRRLPADDGAEGGLYHHQAGRRVS